MDRVLREANVKKWLATSRPRLKPQHIAKRLKWVIAQKDWTAEDPEKVIWSDESSVEKSKDPRQHWVFREPGEKWLADCSQPKEKDKVISLIVWGCFWGKRKGPLVPIPQNINKTRYIRLLRRYLFPVIDEIFSLVYKIFSFSKTMRLFTRLIMLWIGWSDILLKGGTPPLLP